MPHFSIPSVREFDPDRLLVLVVGAHLEAEMADRVLAYRLREHILAWQDVVDCGERLAPVVCSDLWYLNTQPLRLRPTLSLGRPEINAATAYLARRLPTAFLLEEAYRIQLDPEYVDLNGCVWGLTTETTAQALECFIDRYLDTYLRHVHDMPGVGG